MTFEYPTPQQETEAYDEIGYEAYPIEHARRRVFVRRNPNKETGESARIESGWWVDGETFDGKQYVVSKTNPDGSYLEKRIDKDELTKIQNEVYDQRQADNARKVRAPQLPADHALSQPPAEPEPYPVTLDERIEAGKAVPRQELIDAGIIPGIKTEDRS